MDSKPWTVDSKCQGQAASDWQHCWRTFGEDHHVLCSAVVLGRDVYISNEATLFESFPPFFGLVKPSTPFRTCFWLYGNEAVVYGCISSQSFQWLSQSRAWRLQLHPERSCQAKDASRTLQFLGKDEFLTLCSLEVQVVTPVTQNFMNPKLPASLLQVGWGIWMASERRTLTCTYSSERRTWRGRV